MDIVLVTAVVAALFVVIGLSEPLASKIGLPFSVILAVLGTCIGGAALFFLQTDLTDALNPMAEAILGFPITSTCLSMCCCPRCCFKRRWA